MKLISLILVFISPAVLADTAIIKWNIPTARTDGTPMRLDEIGSYTLYVDDIATVTEIDPSATSATVPDLTVGEHCFKMNTTDTEGRVGPFSDVVCKFAKDLPGSPTVITIELAP